MGYRVVIGDDESIIRMDLCEMLEDAGHTVVGEAADGVEALDLVRKEKPDIVLLPVTVQDLCCLTETQVKSTTSIFTIL